MNPTVQHLQKSKKIKPPPPPRSGSMRRMSNLSTNGSTTLSTTQSSYTLPSSATTSPITSESSERFHSLNNTNTGFHAYYFGKNLIQADVENLTLKNPSGNSRVVVRIEIFYNILFIIFYKYFIN